ncbi:MAG: helix-turn-helix transcriptional regulator [Lachnospiraceae bacterium]|nr:helix-turn-helix transcriptional regulator [Lachnospiraceae bacterium]
MNDICHLFGTRIRDLRKAKHMSQEELAFKASISPAHLGQIERAQKNPTLKTINEIANALDVPLTILFEYNQTNETPIKPVTLIEKIEFLLNDMSESQKQDILRIIRITKNFHHEK